MSFFDIRARESVDTATGSNALQALEEAGALFSVDYRPACFQTNEHTFDFPEYPEGKHEGTPLYQFVVRTDTDQPLGLHSGRYPNISDYRQLGELAEQTFPNSTTDVRLWGNGEKVALMQQIAKPADLGGGDTIAPHVVWISSFNGQWATGVHSMTTRLFCTNQLIGGGLLKVKHTMNHNQLFAFRVSVVAAARERAEIMQNMALVLKDQSYTDQQFEELVKTVVPMPPKPEDGELSSRVETMVKKKREEMTRRWNEEVQEWGTPNKWLAYNAVQGAEQHFVNARGDSEEKREFASLERAINGSTPLVERALVSLNG